MLLVVGEFLFEREEGETGKSVLVLDDGSLEFPQTKVVAEEGLEEIALLLKQLPEVFEENDGEDFGDFLESERLFASLLD